MPLATPGSQWALCSLRLPVGTVPTLIADGRGAHPRQAKVQPLHCSSRPTRTVVPVMAPSHSHGAKKGPGRQECNRCTTQPRSSSSQTPGVQRCTARPSPSGVHRVHNPSAAVRSATVALLIPVAKSGIVLLATTRPPVHTMLPSVASGHGAHPDCRWPRCEPSRQVCHRDTVLSPADSIIALVPRHQEPVRSTVQASRKEWHRATCHPRPPADTMLASVASGHRAHPDCRWVRYPP